VRLFDAGHFALETYSNEIATVIASFLDRTRARRRRSAGTSQSLLHTESFLRKSHEYDIEILLGPPRLRPRQSGDARYVLTASGDPVDAR
jgi:hypothetical protein